VKCGCCLAWPEGSGIRAAKRVGAVPASPNNPIAAPRSLSPCDRRLPVTKVIVTHKSVAGHRGCLALTLGPRRGPISIAPGGAQATATRVTVGGKIRP